MAKLKAVMDSIEDVPEAFRELYEERDGKWHLSVESGGGQAEPPTAEEVARMKAKLAEFRDNNVRAMKERDELRKRLESLQGVDPEEYRRLKEEREQGSGGAARKPSGSKADDIESIIKAHVEAAVKPLQKTVHEHETERARLQRELAEKTISEYVSAAAQKAGIVPDLLPDVIGRAKTVFRFKDGGIVPERQDGTPVYDDDGHPLTVETWVPTLPKPFFRPPAGAGAGTTASGTWSGSGTKTLRNPTALEFGKNLEAIASGKMAVEFSPGK